MMSDEKKGVPPVTPKQKSKETLTNGARANTGGDPYDRMRGKYSKDTPKTDRTDPFSSLD